MRSAWALALLAATSAAACKSTEAPPPPTSQPYRVVLLPIEGAKAALEAKPGETDVPLALTPDALESAIRDTVRSSHAFSEVVVARPEDLVARGDEDEMQAAGRFARRNGSDLILRIQVKSARMTDLGPNGATFWSTLTWFMIPAPLWSVDDRTYDTDIAVQAELYEPDDPAKPTASVVASSGKQELDLWDRGITAYVIVVPPPYLAGSPQRVSESLTGRAVRQVLAALVDQLRTREIPSRFELEVTADGANVKLSIASRRKLRSLEVDVDGKAVKTWAETALVEDKESTLEKFVYRRSVELGAKAGAEVRVIAADEAGGREVRTVVIGGSR